MILLVLFDWCSTIQKKEIPWWCSHHIFSDIKVTIFLLWQMGEHLLRIKFSPKDSPRTEISETENCKGGKFWNHRIPGWKILVTRALITSMVTLSLFCIFLNNKMIGKGLWSGISWNDIVLLIIWPMERNYLKILTCWVRPRENINVLFKLQPWGGPRWGVAPPVFPWTSNAI